MLLLAAPAHASASTTPVYDEQGRLVETTFAPENGAARLTEQQALNRFLREGKVADWLERYPPKPTTDADYDPATGEWELKVWSGEAGQIALGTVDDRTGSVREAWTGPQVAWTMARGGAGAFGGKTINTAWVWLVFCGAFLLGLADLRRLRSIRNLDLLVLLSFTVSLRLFNEGEIFWSVPLAYPPLVYLLGRCLWIARADRPPRASRPVWPVWVLAAAAVFLAGFRVGLNIEAPRSTIDVGFAGVIGGQRIANGQVPYGHMPEQGELKECGPADASGEVRERIQTNGRCEASNARGDTYGPVSYLAYVPGYLVFGWTGKWDELWAAHATSLLFDGLCLVGLALVGRRFGGSRLGATLAFAWAAYPFTLYVSNSNTNDAIMPAFLILGFWLASSAWARGAGVALAGWTKFAALLLAPLWLAYPDAIGWPLRLRRGAWKWAAGFAAATIVAFSILLLEPDPLQAARVFGERTFGFQLDRESPFSLWGWGQYHAAGIPNLHLIQQALEVLLVAGALALAFVPRRRSPLQLAALTAAVLIGFELVLTHWFYLYIPWFFPFVAFAVLSASRRE
ncbi:MAG: hypothetical protein MSC30_07195 [Gaiellaceae bacterium MAG52_C11]|nr:hypothetical protein [Candidatus Gaiellasilicea maunaloa]